jgi:TRAP-type mannitol/chloroaromatic compound transport system permease small subunit
MGGQDAAYSWSVREHTNSTWAPPLYPLRIVIPVAASLLFLQGIARFIRDVSIMFTGKELKED